eukprot:superscaffoldBa00009407_g24075
MRSIRCFDVLYVEVQTFVIQLMLSEKRRESREQVQRELVINIKDALIENLTETCFATVSSQSYVAAR